MDQTFNNGMNYIASVELHISGKKIIHSESSRLYSKKKFNQQLNSSNSISNWYYRNMYHFEYIYLIDPSNL